MNLDLKSKYNFLLLSAADLQQIQQLKRMWTWAFSHVTACQAFLATTAAGRMQLMSSQIQTTY